MFEFARRMGYVPDNHSNPVRGVERFREQKRDRWVTPEEMPRLIEAIHAEPNLYVRAALWLLILTGLRKSEMLQIKWEDIDSARSEMRIPRTKAGRTHYLPLSKPAIEVLHSIPRLEGNPYVFPGAREGKHLVNIDKTWGEIRRVAGLPDVRLHDLRRSVGSWLATAGYSLILIGKVLDHTNPSTTAIYSHLTKDPIREALERHGEKIVDIARLRETTEETA
jgi:integrase